ncbi:MAG: hypothetical protein ACQKBY_09635, partial [Verrucomicrobiales bacterium]
IQGEDSIVEYLAATSTVVFEGQNVDRVSLEAIIEANQANVPVQIKVMSKIVSVANDPDLQMGLMGREEINDWFRGVALMPGQEVMLLPSIMMRPGQGASIELIRKVVEFRPEFIGIKMKVNAELSGFGVLAEATYRHHSVLLKGGEWSDRYNPTGVDTDGDTPKKLAEFSGMSLEEQLAGLRKRVMAEEVYFPAGQSLVTKAAGTSELTDYVILTMQRIDAAGRRMR